MEKIANFCKKKEPAGVSGQGPGEGLIRKTKSIQSVSGSPSISMSAFLLPGKIIFHSARMRGMKPSMISMICMSDFRTVTILLPLGVWISTREVSSVWSYSIMVPIWPVFIRITLLPF